MNVNKFDFNRMILLAMLETAKAKSDEQMHDAMVLLAKCAQQPQNMEELLKVSPKSPS